MCVLMFRVKFLNNIIRLVFDLRFTAGDQTTKHHVSCQIRNAGFREARSFTHSTNIHAYFENVPCQVLR